MASSSSSSSPDVAHVVHPSPEHFSFKYASQDDILEDLSSRFILNLPDEELSSVERICFQVEQAHWFYEDFIREENPTFPSLPLKKFSAMLFHSCPLLKQWSHDHEQAFNTFMQYKTRVPVCGAIMLNGTWDKCILVKGWKSSSGWGFPKGKINQDEEPYRCAIREVLEETGYDLSKQINPDDCVEMSIKEQRITLYIVPGVPEDFSFQTRTRKEISKIEWFSLVDLPTWKRNKQVSGKFYLISPFVPPLKEFIRVNKLTRRRQQRKLANGATIAPESNVTSQANGSHNAKQAHKPSRDRNADGSSSQSSVDHAAPQTPSPELQEACAIVLDMEKDLESEKNGGMDPHFARLMQGLSLSATKLTAASTDEPLGVDGKLTKSKDKVEHSAGAPEAVEPTPVSIGSYPAIGQTPNGVNAHNDGTNSSNEAAKTTISVAKSPLGQPPQQERVMRHLALLESLAHESARMAPTVGSRLGPVPQLAYTHGHGAPATLYPGPSSSVPPILHNVPPLPPPMRSNLGPSNGVIGFTSAPQTTAPIPPSIPVPPSLNVDPLTSQMRTRPMTSNAIYNPMFGLFPNNVVNRPTRHGANMSMHQGNLLNILGNERSQPNMPLSSRQIQFTNGAPCPMARPPLPYPSHVSPLLPRAVRVPPTIPSTGGFPTAQNISPMTIPGRPAPHAPGGFISPNTPNDRMHLLSLLKPNSSSLPTPHIVPNYTAGPTRHN